MTALQEEARRLGGHCWLELQLFEIAGRWVPGTSDRHAKLALDRHSGHSAWRAGQWEERLPVLAGVDRQGLVEAPDEGWRRCCAQLAELDDTVARLVGLYRVVLPRLAVRYRAHLAASSPSTDAPTRRTLRMALADLSADRDEGDDVVFSVLEVRPAIETAAAVVAQLESVFSG